MRLLTILIAYIAAAVAAMVVLILLGWIDSGSLALDRIGYIAPLFAGGAATGALFALPIALPTILLTELTRFRSPLIFALAGLLTAAVMAVLVSDFTFAELLNGEPYVVRDLIVISTVTTSASLTYWLVAWKLYPPKTLNAHVKRDRVDRE